MKGIFRIGRLTIGFLLYYGVFAPLFFLIMFAWLTPRFYRLRALAILLGHYGSPAWRREATGWMALSSRVYTTIFRYIMFMKIEIRFADGQEIAPDESYVVISNHISWFDTVAYPGLCDRIGIENVRFVVKESMLVHRPAYYVLTRTWEEACFPFVTRTNPEEDIRRIEKASEIALTDKASMLIFPEGTRQPDGNVGTPKWKGFSAQEKLFQGCPIVSLTQCYDGPVGRTIWWGFTYFRRTIIWDVRVHEPLAPDIDRKAWLEAEFAHKAELIRAVREELS